MEVLKTLSENVPLKAKIGAVIALLLVVAIILVITIPMNQADPQSDTLVNVEDFEDTTSVPDGYKNVIESSIGDMIRSQSDLSTLEFNDAAIRDGTYHERVNGNDRSASFIVDIDSLHYSFAVNVSWVDKKNSLKDPNVVITCPHYLDVIYTDKKCIAQSPRTQLERYLPHYGKVRGVKYAVNFQQEVDSSYLRIEVPACNDPALIEEAKTDVKKWIKSIYLDPNDYKIGSINTCRE